MTIHLRLLGGASLEADSGPVTGPAAHRHRLALLALLAASPSRGRSRETLLALLWPERDAGHARKLLNQSVYVLRRALGEEAILSAGEELRLDAGRVRCDVVAFEEALAAGERERAVALYSGPFLDGFHLDGALEFERWQERARARLADARAAALEELAAEAESQGDRREATRWWKLRAAQDPYDARVALRLVQALARGGNLAAALREADRYRDRLREELEIEPPEEMDALVERLRADPPFTDLEGSASAGELAVEPVREPRATDRGGARDTAPGAADAATRGAEGPGAREGPAFGVIAARAGVVAALILAVGFLLVRLIGDGSRSSGAPSTVTGAAGNVDSLARVVAQEVKRQLTTPPDGRRREASTASIAAVEFFERGNDPVLLRSPEGARRGVELMRRAVALDSSYAPAWAGLAWMRARLSADVAPGAARRTLLAKAEEAARRAVALDGSLPEAHAALGFVRMARFDVAAAEAHLLRAVELDPSGARFRTWLVGPYLWTGRPEAARAEAERAAELESTSPVAQAELARVLVAEGRCAEALERVDHISQLQPPLLRAGPIEAACRADDVAWLSRAAARTSGERSLGFYGFLLARAGARAKALRIRDDLLAREGDEAAGAFPVAMVDAGLGNLDAAFEGFRRGVEDGSLIGSASHFTMLDAVRAAAGDDPRFDDLAERIGLTLLAGGPE